jgi:hypothetical protein
MRFFSSITYLSIGLLLLGCVAGETGVDPAKNATAAIVKNPVVTTVFPIGGPEAGGTTVTISGTDFDNVTAVEFVDGSTILSCTSLVNLSPITLTCSSPAFSGSGVVDVRVVTSDSKTNTLENSFAYTAAPTLDMTGAGTGIGAVGSTVQVVNSNGSEILHVAGTGFDTLATVSLTDAVGAVLACDTLTFVSTTELVCNVPEIASSGPLTVTVTNPDTQSVSDAVTLTSTITVTGVTVTATGVAKGSTAGLDAITVTGFGFGNATLVLTDVSGGVDACDSFAVIDKNSVTCITRAHGVGFVDLDVRNATNSQTGNLPSPAYEYRAPPTISGVVDHVIPTIDYGPIAGGNSIRVTGTNFDTVGGVSVTVGGQACTGPVTEFFRIVDVSTETSRCNFYI